MCSPRRAKVILYTILSFVFCSLNLTASQAGEQRPQEALTAMVDAEKKFYQTGQEKGTRAAFLTFLADDAIVFRPGPVNGKQVWETRPETGLDLVWEPTFAVIARSADLGYTTGPAKWRANKKEDKFSGFGQFISIWKKQKDDTWKVVLDCGIENPEPPGKTGTLVTFVPKNESPAPSHASPKLSDFQQKLVKEARDNLVEALMAVADDEIRVFRDGSLPAVGKKAARVLLEKKPGKISYSPMGGGASQTEDLLYTYGKYALSHGNGESDEGGHYFHIWQMQNGSGKLVVDWAQPLPKEKQ